MIIEFIVASVVAITFVYLCIKLWDKWQLRQLKKKYPEGSVTKSIPVTRLDEVPTANPTNKIILD